MRPRKLSNSHWATALVVAAGLVSHQAAAIEEVIVKGTAPSAPSAAEEIKREMSAYIEALRIEQKARIDAALSEQRGAEIQIAASHLPTRG